MTYFELVDELKKLYNKVDVSDYLGHFAIQFNIEGEAEGALYVEFSEGIIDVQPYEYFDRDLIITTDFETAIDISSGEIKLDEAYSKDKIKVWGEYDMAIELYDFIFEKKAISIKKPASKKGKYGI